jgi:hypothetical protein
VQLGKQFEAISQLTSTQYTRDVSMNEDNLQTELALSEFRINRKTTHPGVV